MSSARRNAPQIDEMSFRRPMAVTAALQFQSGGVYPVCPRCGVTMEREYQRFCDRCGQRLNWSGFHRAAVVIRR